MELKGSTFIVTGGASGLGAATARMVVAGGGNVVVADLKEAEGQALAGELGRSAKFVRTDVTDEASGTAVVAAAVAAFGGLQGLVGCAGIVHAEKVVGKDAPHSLAGFARTIAVNLVGMFNMIRLAADAMSKGAPNAEGERGVRARAWAQMHVGGIGRIRAARVHDDHLRAPLQRLFGALGPQLDRHVELVVVAGRRADDQRFGQGIRRKA